MAFSHTVGGTTFTQANFEGNAYANETNGFPKALEKMVEHVANAYRGTSTTSNAVGSGSKTWTVTNANSQIPAFAVGMPVRVARTSAPTTTYMQGEVTAFTPATGSTTINVSSSLGSGTHTDWTIVIGGHQTTASASPLGVADGGTGAGTLTDGGILLGSGTGAITAMAVLADSEMIVGDGTMDPVAESGATLRTSLGVGTGDSPQFTGLTATGNITAGGLIFDDETLDIYDEGTWTPIFRPYSTVFDSITYGTIRYGRYVIIGHTCHFSFSFRTTAITTGSGAGNMSVWGFPVAPVTVNDHYKAFLADAVTASFAGEEPSILQMGGLANGTLYYNADQTTQKTALAIADVDTGSYKNWVSCTGVYETA